MSDNTETQVPSEATTATEATTEATAEVVVTDNGEATQQEVVYANGKYKSVSDLEKGYEELNKSYSQKLGAFTGAPEAYELPEGIEVSDNIINYAKDNQFSNEALTGLVETYQADQQAKTEAYVAQQKELLGKDADTRLTNLQDWARANGGDEAVFKSMINSAEAVKFMESVMKGSQGTMQAAVPQAPAPAADEVRAMRFAKDEYGNRKMSSDPSYRAKVEDLEAQLFGSR